MAIQFTPLAAFALRYGAVALATYALTRARGVARHPRAVEQAMDRAPQGLRLRRGRREVIGSARWRRTMRLGRRGPGLQLDATALGRLMVRRVP